MTWTDYRLEQGQHKTHLLEEDEARIRLGDPQMRLGTYAKDSLIYLVRMGQDQVKVSKQAGNLWELCYVVLTPPADLDICLLYPGGLGTMLDNNTVFHVLKDGTWEQQEKRRRR